MLFGGDSEHKVGLGQLDAEVDRLFDRRVARLADRASKISKEIKQAKLEFISACEKFDRIKEEPDLERERWMNPGFIKNQKAVYAVALKTLFSNNPDLPGSTHYARYKAELSSIESLIAEMLKINSRNKAVIYAYPNHLESFKSAQAHLERLAVGLRLELDRVKAEFGEYDEINGHLITISALSEEIGATEERLGELESGAPKRLTGKEGDTMAETEAILASKRKELSAIEVRRNEISSKIVSLVMPLEKAARIYDHSSLKKRKLSDIIAYPIQAFGSEGGFEGFMGLLEELKGSVEARRIEVKKPAETLAQISKIKSTDIYEMISALGLVEKEVRSAEGEIRFFERSLDEIKNEMTMLETRIKTINNVKNGIKSLKGSLAMERTAVEQLVMKYYKKKLVIAV